jgi:biotin carboxylase
MRVALEAAEVPQPRFALVDDPDDLPDVGFPCVVKPTRLSGSRGVIRADDVESARAAARRASNIAEGGPLIVEEYVPGVEVALEGLLRDGSLEVLAIFDKPDPLVGPYFEETIYVTPSRLPSNTQARVTRVAADAATALGLLEGPIHAELRIDGDHVWVIEVAARSIGGLCARALRFGAGISLEAVILLHALGRDLEALDRESQATGVMMIPVPHAGRLVAVRGLDTAAGVAGIEGIEITIPEGRTVHPLPDGDRYLGFVFARGDTPETVEDALRAAHACLDVEIDVLNST